MYNQENPSSSKGEPQFKGTLGGTITPPKARGKGTGRACHFSVSHSTPLRGVSFSVEHSILLLPLIN